jgi:hypothetical protein
MVPSSAGAGVVVSDPFGELTAPDSSLRRDFARLAVPMMPEGVDMSKQPHTTTAVTIDTKIPSEWMSGRRLHLADGQSPAALLAPWLESHQRKPSLVPPTGTSKESIQTIVDAAKGSVCQRVGMWELWPEN